MVEWMDGTEKRGKEKTKNKKADAFQKKKCEIRKRKK